MKRLLVAVVVVAAAAGVYFVATQDDADGPEAAETKTTDPDDPNVVTKTPNRKSLLPKTFPGQEEATDPEQVPPEERPRTLTEEELNPAHGLEMVPATDADRAHVKVPDKRWGKGVLVMNVAPDSPADEVRLKKGDLIVRAQREHINTPQDLIDAAKGRDHVVVTFVRDGQYLQVVLKKPYEPSKD
ncbi:MAG: PDZ domain-containing protein [Deltaproteobacteria bacterium]